MSDTVMILGAGFSHTAGIPLTSGFVEKMWQIATRKKVGTESLSQDDIAIFNAAMEVRNELDGYHGRANFNDRNIEDILSLLTFALMGKETGAVEQVRALNRAIARTIELTCSVKHPGLPKDGRYSLIRDGSDLYRQFWLRLIAATGIGHTLPTLITFNYDLVLERALLQVLIGTGYFNTHSNRFPGQRLRLNYHYNNIPDQLFRLKYSDWETNSPRFSREEGTYIEPVSGDDPAQSVFEIDLLKLHGSLNFPIGKSDDFNLALARDDPFILPPIFNKYSNGDPLHMWKVALRKLQSAKNIVVVGYSLPTTDIYMQFFLKAALGPNRNFDKLIVFDPVLFQKSTANDALRQRYEDCFSSQVRSRIVFEPTGDDSGMPGTAQHLVNMLGSEPSAVLF